MEFTKFLLLMLIIIPLTVAITLLLLRKFMQYQVQLNYQAVGQDCIEDLVPLMIGGVKQWLHIRGRNKEAPLLLCLHGGPGSPHIGWFDNIQRPWEDHFIVVQWDQRQSGKSYAPLSKVGSTMTNHQMIEDTKSVICYLRETFQRQKIFVLGKSYGSYLGMHIAKQHPEWLYAYVGDGQMINVMKYAFEEYKHLLDYEEIHGDQSLVQQLKSFAPRPDPERPWSSYTEHEAFIIGCLDKIGKGMAPSAYGTSKGFYRSTLYRRLISNLITSSDLYNHYFADGNCIANTEYSFSKEFMEIDLPSEIGSVFQIPIFLFTGANDWHVPHAYQSEWFDSIEAPYKEQVMFKRSSHYPFIDEPGEYAMSLINKVLPYASN